jgi:DNA-binding ferritin-like protein (Dps family)
MIKTTELIKQLNKSAKNLSLENKKIFDDMVLYTRTSNLKTRDAEEFLQQILDSFLNAEHQGVSIESMLGTSDIKYYCEEIVSTYKSSYNYLSLCSEYIAPTGMIIIVVSIINYILQNITIFIKHGNFNLKFNLNFELGMIFQILLIVFMSITFMAYFNKICFEEPSKSRKTKYFSILKLICILLLCIVIGLPRLAGELLLFKLNIIVVLTIGIALYFIGNYLLEKK